MDTKELQVLIKVTEEGMAATMAKLKLLQEAVGDDRGGGMAGAFGGSLVFAFASLARTIMGLQVPLPWLGNQSLVLVAAFAALLTPVAGFLVALTAMTVVAAVATSGMVALIGAVFMLGTAYMGGLNPSSEMVKMHLQLDTAVKRNKEALLELQQTQQGVILDWGKGLTFAERLSIAHAFVTATTNVMNDKLHDLRETVRGINGPFEALSGMIDDMRHHFEEISAPLAIIIAKFVEGFIPGVQKTGDAIVQWLGPRTTDILQFLSGVVKVVGEGFVSLAQTIGKTIDFVLANKPMFIAYFEGVTGAVFGLVNGIINVSLAIVNWIAQNPKMVDSLRNLVEAGVNFVARAIDGLVQVINGRAGVGDALDNLGGKVQSHRLAQDSLATAINNVATTMTNFLNSKSTKDFVSFWQGLGDALDRVYKVLTAIDVVAQSNYGTMAQEAGQKVYGQKHIIPNQYPSPGQVLQHVQ